MIDLNNINKIFIFPIPVDFRKSILTLSAIVKNDFDLNPFDNSLYIFTNKKKNALKVIHYEFNGFWMYHKKLTDKKDKFKWPKFDSETIISAKALQYLLDGIDIQAKKIFKEKKYNKL